MYKVCFKAVSQIYLYSFQIHYLHPAHVRKKNPNFIVKKPILMSLKVGTFQTKLMGVFDSELS